MSKYPPTELEIFLKYGLLEYAPLVHLKYIGANSYFSPERRGNCFRVPDESDAEAMSSDEDQVKNSCKMLYEKRIRPASFNPSSSSRSPIDLTSDEEQPLLSHVRVGEVPAPPSMPWSLLNRLPNLQGPLEDLPQSVSNEITTPSDDGLWSDEEQISSDKDDVAEDEDESEDELGDEDKIEDDEMEEDAYDLHDVSMDTVKLSENVSGALWASSRADEAEDNEDSALAEDGFDEHGDFQNEEGMLTASNYLTAFDLPPEDELMDHTNSMNDGAKKLLEHPDCSPESRTSNADSSIPNQQNMNAIDHRTPRLPNQLVSLYIKQNPLWDVALPPVAHPPIQPSLQLPSISEWTAKTLTRSPAENATEILGRKTGKAEYFAAREVNKANTMGNLAHPRSTSVGHIQVQSPIVAEQSQEPQRIQVDELPSYDLATSGTRFLNTPQGPFQPVEPEVDAEPILDETSAFSFEQSKKAFGAESAVDTEHQAAVAQKDDKKEAQTSSDAAASPAGKVNEVKVAEVKEVTEPPRSLKRKAEDISRLTREEQLMELRESMVIHGVPCCPPRLSADSLQRDTQRVAQMAATPSPPKRLRRMAEVVGYAALGGVAVMSALIATAPAL